MRFKRVFDWLFPLRADAALIQNLTGDQLYEQLTLQKVLTTNPHTTALLPYHHPLVGAALREAKFHDDHTAQDALGFVLGTFLAQFTNTTPIVVLPVPLSPTRLRERGYNQTERICRAAQRRVPTLHIATDLLARTRTTAPQTTLEAAARHSNLAGAFTLSGMVRTDVRYFLIDDVVTTGATLQAALDACHAHQLSILPIALAH